MGHYCGKGLILQGAECQQNVLHHLKILHTAEHTFLIKFCASTESYEKRSKIHSNYLLPSREP